MRFFYRLNVVPIAPPPLRKSKTDIPVLIYHFLNNYAKENDKTIRGFSKEAQGYLVRYHFPGNVRELENIIERAVVLAREEIITTVDLPAGLNASVENDLFYPKNFAAFYTDKVTGFEKAMIEKALEIKQGNQNRAAELLGISEQRLRSLMQKLKIINTKRLS